MIFAYGSKDCYRPVYMKISVILPTLTSAMSECALKSMIAHSEDIDLEIIVVSSFAIFGDKIVHVPETQPRGNCYANRIGFEAASGDIITVMSEDHLVLPGWLDNAAEILHQKEQSYFPFLGGLHRPDAPIFGTTYGLYYPYFPIATRRSIEAAGGWFSSDYISAFGDCDIAMRFWATGGRCELMPGNHLYLNRLVTKENISPYKGATLDQDFRVFMNKYHDRFGHAFTRDREQISLNVKLELLDESSFTYGRPLVEYVEMGHRGRGRRVYQPPQLVPEFNEPPFVIYQP